MKDLGCVKCLRFRMWGLWFMEGVGVKGFKVAGF